MTDLRDALIIFAPLWVPSTIIATALGVGALLAYRVTSGEPGRGTRTELGDTARHSLPSTR